MPARQSSTGGFHMPDIVHVTLRITYYQSNGANKLSSPKRLFVYYMSNIHHFIISHKTVTICTNLEEKNNRIKSKTKSDNFQLHTWTYKSTVL